MNISDHKSLLRKKLIAHRESISKKDWEQKSELVKEVVLKSKEFKKANVIHCFLSMNDRFEVETHSLVKSMLLKGKRVIIPVMNMVSGTLEHSELTSFSELELNKWGVLEPKELKPFDTNKVDLILVPLLGADLNGNRLGYGKGYYDRFLEKVTASSFGLVFDEFILEKIPIESFDRKLSGIISEKGLTYT